MHKITKFDMNTTYNPFVDERIVAIMQEKIIDYNNVCAAIEMDDGEPKEDYVLDMLNDMKRNKYLEILYSNPAGCQITAGLTTNYRQFKTIYAQRKNHRLPEWREFCKWIETLPMSELITGAK